MPKKLLHKDKTLPNKPHGKGVGWNIKFFPDSATGKDNSQFCKGGSGQKPNTTQFDKWVDYYECVIGSGVEKLNALQFNWNQSGDQDAQAAAFADALNDFGAKLKGGSTQMVMMATGNPVTQLEWPLNGTYYVSPLEPTAAGLAGKKCNAFNITVTFFKDSDYEMVVNVEILFTAEYALDPKDSGGPDDTSGASSYIATSSSH